MRRDIAPDGYLSISDAVRIVADTPEYSDSDLEWLDICDRLNTAEALDLATKKLRQWLCDGALIAYARDLSGEKTKVPEWTWTDDKACLADRSGDEIFREFQFFSADGVKIQEKWFPVFVLERKFESLCAGGANTSPKINKIEKRRPGRPKGSAAFNDEKWLEKMESLVLKGHTPFGAAESVVADFKKDIQRKPGVIKDEHIAQRLYKKYIESDRPQKITASTD